MHTSLFVEKLNEWFKTGNIRHYIINGCILLIKFNIKDQESDSKSVSKTKYLKSIWLVTAILLDIFSKPNLMPFLPKYFS